MTASRSDGLDRGGGGLAERLAAEQFVEREHRLGPVAAAFGQILEEMDGPVARPGRAPGRSAFLVVGEQAQPREELREERADQHQAGIGDGDAQARFLVRSVPQLALYLLDGVAAPFAHRLFHIVGRTPRAAAVVGALFEQGAQRRMAPGPGEPGKGRLRRLAAALPRRRPQPRPCRAVQQPRDEHVEPATRRRGREQALPPGGPGQASATCLQRRRGELGRAQQAQSLGRARRREQSREQAFRHRSDEARARRR
jgi:hypothetical protein